MKKLFEFTLNKEIIETQKETSTNEKGETVTVEKSIKKDVSQKIFLRKPGRAMFDEAELFYGVKLSEGIKAGLLTRQLLAKRFSNDGGILSESEKNKYAESYVKLFDVQNKIERASIKKEEERTQEEKDALAPLLKEASELKDQLVEFEMGQASLFEQTAENRARNKTILWWILSLSYLEDDKGVATTVFGDGAFEARLAKYDEMEESEDAFSESLLKKLMYYISFWYVGRAQTKEDFDELIKQSNAAT